MRLELLKPSTKAFVREARQTPGFSLFDLLHGYVYGSLPYLYTSIATGEHPLSKYVMPVVNLFIKLFSGAKTNAEGAKVFANGYHGKVVPLAAAKQLVMINEEIKLSNLEKVIPYSKARDIIMKNPQHIVALDCPCRSSRPNPCLPLDVCLIVGEPFASLIAEHQPGHARRIDAEEASRILQAEHERGHVHHAFFKDAMLGRFYAICNCCTCCCGALQARKIGVPMLASSGFVSQVSADDCQACGECVNQCPFGALSLADEVVTVNEARCMGCGICVDVCPSNALNLRREPSKGEPLEIQRLMAEFVVEQTA